MKRSRKSFWSVLFLVIGAAAVTSPAFANAITFTTLDYDNTANTVGSGPTPVNNQTTGVFRDLQWWQINNAQPKVGSSDFINQGNHLVLQSNHAVPGASGPTSLNFTGPSISGGQAYMALYDTTPGDGSATKNVFDASVPGGLTISQDVLFIKHNASAGMFTMFNEGQDGLALLATNRDGNNTDYSGLSLVYQNGGQDIELAKTTLAAGTFTANNWYRMIMNVSVVGDTYTVFGEFYRHLTETDPNSALGTLLNSVTFSGSVSTPQDPSRVLSNPGQVGIIVFGNESISLPDNVGVSVTNFNVPGLTTETTSLVTPEPASLFLLGSGILAVGRFARRKK